MATKKANRPRSAKADAEWLYAALRRIRRAEEEVARVYPSVIVVSPIHLSSCFLRHDTIKYFEYDIVGNSIPNAELTYDCGFFVGNYLQNLTAQIEMPRRVLDGAVQ